MANVGWRYILADTETLEPIDEIAHAKGRTLSMALATSGNANFNVALDDRVGSMIRSLETSVLAVQDDDIQWSGFVWTIDDKAEINRRTVNVVGWFEELNKRIVRPPYKDLRPIDVPSQAQDFLNVDASVIIRALVDKANEQRDDLGTLRPTHVTNGTYDLSNLRTYSAQPGQKIGEEIRKFSQIEGGVDLWIDPVTRELHIYWDQIIPESSVFGKGTDKRNDIVLGYNFGPENLAEAGRTINPDRTVMRLTASAPIGSRRAEDRDAMDQTGFMFEDMINLPEAKNVDILAAYAGAEVAIRSYPFTIYGIRPFPWTQENSSPRPLKDYTLGDIVSATAVQGAFKLQKQAMRVHGIELSIPDDGASEIVTSLQTMRNA
jgi:hypothetical protein